MGSDQHDRAGTRGDSFPPVALAPKTLARGPNTLGAAFLCMAKGARARARSASLTMAGSPALASAPRERGWAAERSPRLRALRSPAVQCAGRALAADPSAPSARDDSMRHVGSPASARGPLLEMETPSRALGDPPVLL